MRSRVGIGYDSHRLVDGRALVLGGVEIPFDQGLLGHSDGDALLHAITDALLGAAGLPDIGQIFPNSATEWKDADSQDLLYEVGGRVRAAGWEIGNVDAVLIAEHPKISPYITQMKERIAGALQIETGCVNLKGKTAEGLGALGAGEGMAAHAVCLLYAAD